MKNIAIIIGQIYLDSQRKILLSIYEECKKYNCNLTVFSFFSSTEDKYNDGEFELFNRTDLEEYDGFILYSETIYSSKARQKLREKIFNSNKKFVCIDEVIDGVISVFSDNVKSVKTIADSIFNKNDIKIINYITGPIDSNDSSQRIDTFIKVAKEHGIDYNKERIYVGDFFSESGNQAIDYYRNNNLLDADLYVCANDQMALGAYFGLSELGINVPDECLITGFDNIIQSKFNAVPITSIERNESLVGKTAFLKLLAAVKGKKVESSIISSIPVFRESTNDIDEETTFEEKNEYFNSRMKKNFENTMFTSILNDSNTEFMTATSVDELSEQLVSYLKRFKVNEFYLCIDKNKNKDNIDIALSYKNGQCKRNLSIKKKDVKISLNGIKGGDISIVFPLHYSDNYYGFAITKNYMLPIESEFFNTFMINLSNKLKSLDDAEKFANTYKYDALTNLYTRKGFFEIADKIFDTYRDKEDMYIIYIDLDGLKKVNDNLGHKYGDIFISDFADILKEERVAKYTVTSRFGGDEFVIFGKGKNEAEIADMIEYINERIKSINSLKKAEYYPFELGASIGYYNINENEYSLSSLIDQADKEMYEAKRERKRSINKI